MGSTLKAALDEIGFVDRSALEEVETKITSKAESRQGGAEKSSS